MIKFIFRIILLAIPFFLVLFIFIGLLTGGVYVLTKNLFDEKTTNYVLGTITILLPAIFYLTKKKRK